MALALRVAIQGQKSLDVQGPPLPVAIVMDLSASKSLCPAKAGTWDILCKRIHAISGPTSLDFQGPPPSNGLCNEIVPIKGGGGTRGPETHVHKTHIIHYRIQNTEYRIQNTEHTTQNTETHGHKITSVPVFFI